MPTVRMRGKRVRYKKTPQRTFINSQKVATKKCNKRKNIHKKVYTLKYFRKPSTLLLKVLQKHQAASPLIFNQCAPVIRIVDINVESN